MKIVGLLCAGSIALGAVVAAAAPAAAAGDASVSKPATAGARHWRHKHHRGYARVPTESSADAARRAYYRSLEPYRSMDFRGEFPGNCAVQRAAGECMIDLGYGRCESCSVGGPP